MHASEKLFCALAVHAQILSRSVVVGPRIFVFQASPGRLPGRRGVGLAGQPGEITRYVSSRVV